MIKGTNLLKGINFFFILSI